MRGNWLTIVLILVVSSSCRDTLDKDLGGGYSLYIGDGYYTAILNSQNTIVVPEVLEFNFDSAFIIASQRPWDSIPNIKEMTYSESNKAFKESDFRQYWIINKKEESVFDEKRKKYANVYGPFKKEEYLQRREELGIPQELQLKETQ